MNVHQFYNETRVRERADKRSNMRDVVKFNGSPVAVKLEYSSGKEGAGEHGTFYTYTLGGGKIMFASDILNGRIQELRPRAGDWVQIQKREGNRWDVRKLTPPTSEPGITPPASSQTVAVGPSQSTQQENGNTRQDTLTKLGNILVHGDPNPQPAPACLMTGQSQFCLQQLIAAIELTHAAEKYAKAMGRPVEFTSEDIRAIAISCFISQDRKAQGGR